MNSLSLIAGALAVMTATTDPVTLSPNPLLGADGHAIVAHRACWGPAPENSLQAVQTCVRDGVRVLEIDVRHTRDGALVLLHDASLDRTTGMTGPLDQMLVAELEGVTLREGAGGPDAPLTAEEVPTLEEALLALGPDTIVNLDVKVDDLQATWALVRRLGLEDQVLMKSRHAPGAPDLEALVSTGGGLFMPILAECTERYRPLCQPDPEAALAARAVLNPVAVEVLFENDAYLERVLEAAETRGLPVWVNTLAPFHAGGRTDARSLHDPHAIWGDLLDRGVSIIQTDRPQALKEYLEDRSERSVAP